MRYYKLTIENIPSVIYASMLSDDVKSAKHFTSTDKLVISSKTRSGKVDPSPLQIEFAIKAFSNAADSIPATIKLYNVSSTLFKFLGKVANEKCPLTLEAGWNNSIVLHPALNYKNIPNQIILVGNIQNVVGDFSGRDKYIILTTALTMPREEALQRQENRSGSQNKADFSVQIAKGDSYESFIKKAFEFVLDKSYKLVFSTAISAAVWKGNAGTLLAFNTLDDLRFLLNRALEIPVGVDIDTTRGRADLYKLGDLADKATTYDGTTIEIDYTDLLEQPEFLGYSNMLSVLTRLRPDIHLNSVVKIKKTTLVAGSAVSGTTFTSEGLTPFLSGEDEFIVNEIIHQGNFYGKSADSWSSQMQLVPKSGSNKKLIKQNAEKS